MNEVKHSTKLKKDDLVKVISGKDRGKQGKILHIDMVKGRAIVQGIAAAHGGRVTVESREGKGSRFSVLLPRS